MDSDDIMKRWYNEKRMNSIEGDSGLQKMEELFEAVGYGHGFRHGSSLEHFLSDNPGACEAIMEWFEGQLEMQKDWQESMVEELGEETWGIEVDWRADERGDPFGVKYAEGMGIEVRTLIERGPGGGWPVLRFEGPSSVMVAVAKELDPGDGSVTDQLKDGDDEA